MSWQDEFNALAYAEQYKIREMATIFKVPVSAAYFRAKELGLLSPEPERKENSSFVPVQKTGTVVPSAEDVVHELTAGFGHRWPEDYAAQIVRAVLTATATTQDRLSSKNDDPCNSADPDCDGCAGTGLWADGETICPCTSENPARQTNVEPYRNDEAGYVEFLNEDRPYIVRDLPAPCAILVDMETRNVIGYRVYDPDRQPPSPHLGGDGEAAIIECLAAGEPFVFDPATNFLHADDGSVEGGIRYVPAPQEQMVGWRDIGTAPRDGSEILIWNGRRRHVAHFDKIEGEWVSSFKTTTKRLIVTPPPTHWSPLPTEPATTEGQP